ncbi:MAG: hypothetical protein WBL27_02090 [Salinimicrobium sp.]
MFASKGEHFAAVLFGRSAERAAYLKSDIPARLFPDGKREQQDDRQGIREKKKHCAENGTANNPGYVDGNENLNNDCKSDAGVPQKCGQTLPKQERAGAQPEKPTGTSSANSSAKKFCQA